MLSITLQTNSTTFLSGILLQEIVFELFHSAFAWDTQLHRWCLRRVQLYYKTLKTSSYAIPYPDNLAEWKSVMSG